MTKASYRCVRVRFIEEHASHQPFTPLSPPTPPYSLFPLYHQYQKLTIQNPSDPDCWWTWQGCTTPDPALGIPADLYDIPEPNSLALTIDDGPNCSQNAFYEFLREQNQKASM